MNAYPFGSFDRLRELAAGRPIGLFGLGTVASATMARLGEPPAVLIDNEIGLAGARQSGVMIMGPDYLKSGPGADLYLVVCTADIKEATLFLRSLGFRPERDYLISPLLHQQQTVLELEDRQARLLFTSGAADAAAPGWGGGVYELELNGEAYSYRKVYSGPCYSIRAVADGFVAVDPRRGLLVINRRYELLREVPLPLPAWCHGLAYSPAHARYYVAATQLDKVAVYDEDFRLEGEIPLSTKVSPDRQGFHHPNDLFIHGQSLFVSVFSVSGHWRHDVNDGGILEIDLNSSRVAGPVVDGLWMPHNPMVIDDSLVVLDSFRGRLCRSGGRVVGQFPGFVRGLAHDGRFFYVGQNRNRQYHKLPPGAACISLDTAIVLFDERTKLSRSIPLPRGLTDIHSILVPESGGEEPVPRRLPSSVLRLPSNS